MKAILAASLILSFTAANAASNAVIDAVLASNVCKKLGDFYWEVGNANGPVASGQVGNTYGRYTVIPIASASKMIYAAYVAQKRRGIYTEDDKVYLNFQSGVTEFDQCDRFQTIGQCASGAVFRIENGNKFFYSGGHMQQHASTVMKLANMRTSQFAQEINSTLGTNFTYSQAQPAGGATASASSYAVLLTRIIGNKLIFDAHLGDSPVCTSFNACPTKAVQGASPIPEPWSYGLGYWIENQPGGDGAFSSPGAFGFYPWISADKKTYGIISHKSLLGAWSSVQCGREIRKAYLRP